MKPVEVVLVDDHKLFRSGIASLISTFNNYRVMFEAGNGKEFCDKISKNFQPDIVLLDYNMPQMDGLETAEWLNNNYPDVKVIILSMFADEDKVVALIKAGIKGYLLKDADPSEFKEALDAVSNNDIYYPAFVARHLARNLTNPKNEEVKITEREIEFLNLLASDLTYREIADAMNIGYRTAESYRDNLFLRFNVKTRVSLVLYALKNNLIKL